MQVYTNCPIALADWNLCEQEPAPDFQHTAIPPGLWHEFAGKGSPWHLNWDSKDLPDGIALVVERTDRSQFDRMVDLARSDRVMPDFLACVALEGDNFHGQSERPWTASRGNLHLTLHVRAAIEANHAQEAISILPTVALMDAFGLAACPEEHTGIRWLNDLFISGRKVGGSIAESQIEGDRVESIVYGIGLNVESDPDVSPTLFVPGAASLQSTMLEGAWTLGKAFERLLKAMRRRLIQLQSGDSEGLKQSYIRGSACIGQEVRVWPRKVLNPEHDRPIAVGRLLAIQPDLSLLIEGQPDPIHEGRLAFESDCRALRI